MSTTDLTARYGTRSRRSRWLAAGVVAAVVAPFVVGLVVFLPALADPEAASGQLTFDVVDDRTAVARFSVELDDDVVEATCSLKAYAEDHSLVGALSFAVPQGSTRVEQAVATERRATSVELVGCTAPGQNRPR